MTTCVAERVKRHRQRKRTGAGVIAFIVVSDEVATIEMLITARLLEPSAVDDPSAISAAVGRLIDILSKEASS